jgi:hypothetical protein
MREGKKKGAVAPAVRLPCQPCRKGCGSGKSIDTGQRRKRMSPSGDAAVSACGRRGAQDPPRGRSAVDGRWLFPCTRSCLTGSAAISRGLARRRPCGHRATFRLRTPDAAARRSIIVGPVFERVNTGFGNDAVENERPLRERGGVRPDSGFPGEGFCRFAAFPDAAVLVDQDRRQTSGNDHDHDDLDGDP